LHCIRGLAMGGGYYSGKGGGKGGGGGGKGGGGGGKGGGGGGYYDGGGKAAAATSDFSPGSGKGDGWQTKGDAGSSRTNDKLPAAVVRKLTVLNYPELDAASLSGQAYCKIVLWLEEEKIRLYDKMDRKPMRDFNKAWYPKVAEYCRDLGVAAEGLSERDLAVKLQVLNSLCNLAMHDVYRDKVEASELNVVPPPKSMRMGADKQRLREMLPALNRLLESFSLPQLPDDSVDSDTVAALRCVHARVCTPSGNADSGDFIDLNNLPVGVPTTDPDVKRAAAVLRVLHGNELQELQVNINHVINELQQLTADPKTDARLGRVGR